MTPKPTHFERERRNSLSLRQKGKMLQDLKDMAKTKTDIAQKFNIYRTTIRKIQTNAEEFLRAASNRGCRRNKNNSSSR